MAELQVLEHKKNPSLKREEVKVVIEAEKNPNFNDTAKILSEHFKKSEDAIKIRLIRGKFGRDTFLVSANLYNTKEDMNKIEPKSKKEKAAEAKAGEAKTEEKK